MDAVNTKSYALGLRDIAAWQLPGLCLEADTKKLAAGLPSLQRGAVWRPNQVELLWDSIMRGFPIGSLVVTPQIEGQSTRGGKHGEELSEYTHHLLDGQQRANAIALGYLDPFTDKTKEDTKNILWLDLVPQGSSVLQCEAVAGFNASTRSFLLRNTTSAHPWGFKVSDDATPVRIESAQARKAKKSFNNSEYKKAGKGAESHPSPVEGWPVEANAPIPLAWMLDVFEAQIEQNKLLGLDSFAERGFWVALSDKYLAKYPKQFAESEEGYYFTQWRLRLAKLISSWINADNLPEQSSHLIKGVARAVNMKMVALELSSDVLKGAFRPNGDSENDKVEHEDPIANVEHLFQRLNGGGTDLSAADRAYSMIKAYWPGVEHSIDAIRQRPPETQVALLGARLALDGIQNNANKEASLPPQPTVRSLRRLAVDKTKSEEATRIKAMFGLLGDGVPEDKVTVPIEQAITKLDEWILYSEAKPWGLPPVLRSRMATQAPEVFLFLLRLANYKVINNSPEPDEGTQRQLLGLATAVHWFGLKRDRVVQKLWSCTPEEYLYGGALDGALEKIIEYGLQGDKKELIARIIRPSELEAYIDINSFDKAKLCSWRWWETLVVEPASRKAKELDPNASQRQIDAQIQLRWSQFGSLISVLSHGWYNRNNALLLMYAQREQMHYFFKDYSAKDSDFWAEHNVPWDFDHMLQRSAYYNIKSNNAFMGVCGQWGNTIGNLHILPFELNRSRQDDPLKTVIDHLGLVEENGFLQRMHISNNKNAKNKLSAFSMESGEIRGSDETSPPAEVVDFILGARARLISLYSDWFETLRVEELISKVR